MKIEDVFALFQDELREVARWMEQALSSEAGLIPEIGHHIIGGGGKRLRPLLLISSAAACGGKKESRYPLAAVMEFIHTASLLHDDVVDGAETRRGRISANNIWGNAASVLVGDYLYARSFDLMSRYGDIRVIRVLARATTDMAEGEVLQLMKLGDIHITQDDYLKIIERKTAVLISAACEIGAILGEGTDGNIDRLARFGRYIGMAFQIVDDALDYVADDGGFGKAIGKDLDEGKLTLPLIRALAMGSEAERAQVAEIVRKPAREERDFRWIKMLIDRYDGIGYAMARAEELVSEGKKTLESLAPSPSRQALGAIADYVVTRRM